MRARALAAAYLLVLGACSGDGVGPGEAVGAVRLSRGTAEDATLWDFCDPELPEPGTFERACQVPPLDLLRIGPGWRAASSEELEAEWEELEWEVSLDGRPLALDEFGTLPDTSLADGSSVREWKVTAEGLAGDHRLQASITRGDSTYDVTWLLAVGR